MYFAIFNWIKDYLIGVSCFRKVIICYKTECWCDVIITSDLFNTVWWVTMERNDPYWLCTKTRNNIFSFLFPRRQLTLETLSLPKTQIFSRKNVSLNLGDTIEKSQSEVISLQKNYKIYTGKTRGQIIHID